MMERLNWRNGEPVEEPVEPLAVLQDPAVRALLDHVAEELASEFVRLMRGSGATDEEGEPKEKKP